MARNQRIFYACQAVAIAPRGTDPIADEHIVHGVQSVGMTSTFTLDQVFELGQVEIYENIEEVADIEVTLEKVIDGFKLMFDLATNGNCKTDLVTASKSQCDVHVSVFDDGLSHATGVPRNKCFNSGMYVSSVTYNWSVDGSATESITLVGNDRFWNGGHGVVADSVWDHADLLGAGNAEAIDGTDTPLSGVVRRVDCDIENSTIPQTVLNQGGDDPVGQGGSAHIQSINISTDFGQENIQELGRFGPYHRYATFPIEVTCDFEVIATSGDLVSVSGNDANASNPGVSITVKDTAGTVVNLGSNNKLSNVSYTGGDTGGGNATVTYSYSNFNVMTVNGGDLGAVT